MKDKSDDLAVVGPTRGGARRAASWLSRRRRTLAAPFSLADYLGSPRAPSRIVLAPGGRSVASDLAFLRRCGRRLLWPAPDDILVEAIEGFQGSVERHRLSRSMSRPWPRKAGNLEAFLLEGAVTSARVRSLAASPGLWIVESPRRVRIGRSLWNRLDRLEIRWAALEPVTVAGLVASAALARERPRWRRLLPPKTPVWIRKN